MSFIKSQRTLYVNSRNRSSGTDSDFMYTFEFPFDNKFTHCAILQCIIPKSYYLVQNGYNTFILSEDSMQVIVTVPIGNYSRSLFRTTIQGLLNSSSPNGYVYVVTQPPSTVPDTGKYTFTVTGNMGIQPIFIFTNNNLNEQFGFEETSQNQFVSDSLESLNVIKMQIEDALFIRSTICDNVNDNIIQAVFLSNNPDYSELYFESPDVQAYSKKISHNTSRTYRFWITDEGGIPIYFNGQNIVFSLLLYEKEDIFRLMEDYIKLRLMEK